MNKNKTAGRGPPSNIGVNFAIVIFNAALIGVLWAAVLEIVKVDRRETISTAIDRNDNLAIALEQYTQRTIESADAVIQYMIREYVRTSRKIDLDQFVTDYTIDNKAFAGIVMADEHGNLATTAFMGKPEKPVNVADREHFRVHLARDTQEVFVGKPVTGRITGKAVVPITRRVNKPDGSFGGVAMVLIEHARFTDVLHDAKMRQLDIISVIGLDGITRARLRGTTPTTGEDISKSPLFAEQAQHTNGNYAARGQVDGIKRIFSYRTMPEYRLIASVGAAEADVLAGFYQRQRQYFWAAGISSFFITGFSLLLILMLTRQQLAALAEAKLAAIVESSNDAIISSVPDNKKILSWNRAAERMFGWSASEVIGQSVRIITPPEFIGRLEPLIRRTMHGETLAPVETWRQRKDGSRFEAQISFSDVRDQSGTIIAIATIVRDISERREKEAIAQKEKLFSDAMIESMPGIVYFYNEERRFLRWNRNFTRVAGYSPEEIAGMHPLDFFSGEDKRRVAKKIKEVFEKGESSVEAAFISRDGSAVPYFFTGNRVVFDGAVCLIGMGIDIRERKLAEAALRDHAAQMRHLSWRLSEVEERERRDIHRELHDRVGANLAALKLDLGLINSMLSTEDRKTVGDRLQKAQQLTGETITQIRDVMGNLRPPALDDFGLLAALRTCAQPHAARMGIPITVDGDDIEPRLGIAVETALFRIVQEALSNVAKHAQARHVAITITTTADRVILVVADDGTGFDAARPGQQIDNWGLRTMRERAQAIAADLSIESSPGKGTRIVVELAREAA